MVIQKLSGPFPGSTQVSGIRKNDRSQITNVIAKLNKIIYFRSTPDSYTTAHSLGMELEA